MVEVTATGAAADAVRVRVPGLVDERFASRLFAQDATLWGPEAEAESAIRLSWVGLATSSRPLVDEVAAIRAALPAEVDHVVLAGMGGSSLAPEVICATAGVPLTVLDSSDPDYVRAALADRLERTVVVVSSKSGGTVETDSQRRAYSAAFTAAGIDPAGRIVVVTDPGSPLEASARADGHHVVLADPNVGGRYSALTAFGLVPSALAGVDVGALLDEAQAVTDLLAEDGEGNPALVLGAALAGLAPADQAGRRDKLALAADGTSVVGFADWAEQLVAESTGKQGTGLLPVVVEGPQAPEVRWPASDVLPLLLVAAGGEPDAEPGEGEGGAGAQTGVSVGGSLGALMLLWEAATAVAGRLLSINPFDQPDVESAKKAARGMLEGAPVATAPDLVDAGIELRGTPGLLDGVNDLPGAVAALLARLEPGRGYLAVMAYLDRSAQASLAGVRAPLALRTERPTTFGWGPRFLHSTGQYHKGGPATGVYLQVTGDPAADLDVPGQPFTFGGLIAAQAAGDAQVLADHGRPVLRVHLTDRAAGVARLLEVLQ
ncbi:glucose-6-phosphate isomerase [Angustibacter sp. McL0619]|uniref:glucose-6-phosphate isomerase n=1 Tax=Angustibacter sp. McL0619 TaxID=3415676 RepID=UPI003CF667C6